MAQERVSLHADGIRLRATLDRPDRGNAIDIALIDQLDAALDRAEADPDCRIVVVAGRGWAHCSGMDIASATDSEADSETTARRFYALLRRFTTTPRMIVSVVDGQVSGGGVGLVAASDLVFASPRSTFGLPEALWGLLPCCVLPFLIRRVGFQRAYSMSLTTLPVSAEQGAACQLVDQVSEQTDLALQRLSFRVGKVASEVVGDLKRYLARLRPTDLDVEDVAVTELARLTSSDRVRRNFADFVAQGRAPWEQARESDPARGRSAR